MKHTYIHTNTHTSIHMERTNLQVVYAGAEALGVPQDWVRRAHVLKLLRAGEDVLAEDLLVQVRGVVLGGGR